MDSIRIRKGIKSQNHQMLMRPSISICYFQEVLFSYKHQLTREGRLRSENNLKTMLRDVDVQFATSRNLHTEPLQHHF